MISTKIRCYEAIIYPYERRLELEHEARPFSFADDDDIIQTERSGHQARFGSEKARGGEAEATKVVGFNMRLLELNIAGWSWTTATCRRGTMGPRNCNSEENELRLNFSAIKIPVEGMGGSEYSSRYDTMPLRPVARYQRTSLRFFAESKSITTSLDFTLFHSPFPFSAPRLHLFRSRC